MKTLVQQVAHERALINKHVTKLQELLATCTHENQELKSQYFSGGYLDTSYIERWSECTLCKLQFGHKESQRGGYA